MRITVIAPVVSHEINRESVKSLKSIVGESCKISIVFLDRGPLSIESEFEESFSVPGVIERAIEAEKNGSDGIVLNCMLDPGLKAVREAVRIPVFGPAQTSMHIASTLGNKITIITVLERLIPLMENLCKSYGLLGQLASIRAIDKPVLEIENDPDIVIQPTTELILEAIKNDGCDTIVFGCTGMTGISDKVSMQLKKHGYVLPIIDPSVVTIKYAESLITLGIRHSQLAYPSPPKNNIIGWGNKLVAH
jgi:allantoin racemase